MEDLELRKPGGPVESGLLWLPSLGGGLVRQGAGGPMEWSVQPQGGPPSGSCPPAALGQ